MTPVSTVLLSHPLRFQKVIYAYYNRRGRSLPWRRTVNPYHILVSEIMLQQTQVSRVVEKYSSFIKKFPTFAALAATPVYHVVKAWHGLGYNRRALALKKIATIITAQHKGKLPSSLEELKKLPGIGPATAASIAAFAFNKPTVFIETNIRTVFIHFFFKKRTAVHDREIMPLVRQTLDHTNPRRWYWALMDHGAMLKKNYGNLSRRSAHYVKQSPFAGSNRQLRGMILNILTQQPTISQALLLQRIQRPAQHIQRSLTQLEHEGFIQQKRKKISISTNMTLAAAPQDREEK